MKSQAHIASPKTFLTHIALGLLCVFCIAYSIFASDFAELFATLPGIPFPIFVGEILLFICILLVLPYFRQTFQQGSWWVAFLIIFYGVWLLTKTFLGFKSFGPLALRNAALFYYPGFLLIGYAVYDPHLLTERWRWGLVIGLVLLLFFAPVINYFYVTYYVVIFALVWSSPKIRLKLLILFLIILHLLQHGFFWHGSRSHLIGICLGVIFSVTYFLYGLFPLSIKKKLILTFSLGIAFGGSLFIFGDHNAITSMLTFKELKKEYNRYNEEIEQKRPFYKPAPLQLGLYHENAKMCLDGVWRGYIPKKRYKRILNLDEHSFERAPETPKVAMANASDHDSKILTKSKIKYPSKQVTNKEILPPEPQKVVVKSVPVESKMTKKLFFQNHEQFDVSVKGDDVVVEEQEPLIVNRFSREGERSLEVAYNNIFFRLFIWRDMWDQLKKEKAWWGVNLGEPQRSPSIEILNWAVIEWSRDGWITPHNSFYHAIYRAGLVGVGLVGIFFGLVIYMSYRFYKLGSIAGGLLMANVFYWIGISSFLVILELPYNAIPFWTFIGMVLGYLKDLQKVQHPA